MSEQATIGLVGILIAILGALIGHMFKDGQYRQKVDTLERQVDAGILPRTEERLQALQREIDDLKRVRS